MPITVETNEEVTSVDEQNTNEVEEKPEAEESEQAEEASESQEEGSESDTEEEEGESEESEDDEDESEGDEEDNDEDDEEKEEKKPKRKNGFKKRVDRLNRQKRALADENARLKQELERAKSGKSEKKESEVEEPALELKDGKPNVDDFENYDDYVEELSAWRYRQEKKADEKKAQEKALKKEQEDLDKSFAKKVIEFSETVDDWEEVLEDVEDIVANPGLGHIIKTSDYSAQVMYELAKNPENFRRINELSYVKAAKAIGRIEDQIEAKVKPSEKKPSEIVKKTKAPKPLKKVGSKGKGTPTRLDDPEISQREFERLRAEQIKQRNAY